MCTSAVKEPEEKGIMYLAALDASTFTSTQHLVFLPIQNFVRVHVLFSSYFHFVFAVKIFFFLIPIFCLINSEIPPKQVFY